MGKVTISPQNSSMKSSSYKAEPQLPLSLTPVEQSLTVPIQPYIEVIKEIHVPFETIRYVDVPKEVIVEKIIERQVLSEPIIKYIEVPKEVIVEKIVEVQAYDLYDGAVIQLDMLRRRHEKLQKQNKILKILIPIIAVVALIGYII